jgi:hypothetical protein
LAEERGTPRPELAFADPRSEREIELEALTENLSVERDQLISQRDTLALKNKMLRDAISQMQPVQDVANKLDTLTRQLDTLAQFLTAQGLETEARLSNIEANLPV